ncbi:MAG: dethiobiotin synthase [Gammaproteobacteria bacterium]|nr:dethiobiotin synthase [Gammaproteobacteria bacterium]MDH5799594.1 dethiobiotin synthase [Gammaproteobacteria bacterium]
MSRGLFITGTDTGIGKTTASQLIIGQLIQMGYRVAAMKPIASGCETTAKGLRNEDAVALMTCANVDIPYETVNPYAYLEPIAPHIAAQKAAKEIQIPVILERFQHIATEADVVIVEGVGGWSVPISPTHTTADLAQALNLPVVMVSGIRLGCLNHSLLTARAIRADHLSCAAWIANHPQNDTDYSAENIEYLCQHLDCPLLGRIPYAPDSTQAYLDETTLRRVLGNLR